MNGLTFVFFATLPIFGAAFVLAFVRLLLGPSLPDRVVALDLMATIAIGFICAYAIANNQHILLDVASVMALLAFLATVAFAYHMKRGM